MDKVLLLLLLLFLDRNMAPERHDFIAQIIVMRVAEYLADSPKIIEKYEIGRPCEGIHRINTSYEVPILHFNELEYEDRTRMTVSFIAEEIKNVCQEEHNVIHAYCTCNYDRNTKQADINFYWWGQNE